jgi:hypothetical protein
MLLPLNQPQTMAGGFLSTNCGAEKSTPLLPTRNPSQREQAEARPRWRAAFLRLAMCDHVYALSPAASQSPRIFLV